MKKFLLMASISAMSIVGNAEQLQGFKNIKFGMTEQQVNDMGFVCTETGSKYNSYKKCTNKSFTTTLFDETVDETFVYLDSENKVKSISLYMYKNCINAMNAGTNSLGKNFTYSDRGYFTWNYDNAYIMYSINYCNYSFVSKNYATTTVAPNKDF